jgi:Cu/Ag efflux protein CusF
VISVKRSIALIVAILFALTVGIAFAEQAQQPAAPEKAAPAEKKAPATKYLSVKGEVTAVDPAANSITIKSKKQEVQLTVTDKTKVMIGKEKKSLADVKVGDAAVAKYKKEKDKNVATSINVTPKKAEAAPAPAPAKPAEPAKK